MVDSLSKVTYCTKFDSSSRNICVFAYHDIIQVEWAKNLVNSIWFKTTYFQFGIHDIGIDRDLTFMVTRLHNHPLRVHTFMPLVLGL